MAGLGFDERPISGMIIRPPGWYLALYGSSFIACVLIGLIGVFALRSTTGFVFGGMFLLYNSTSRRVERLKNLVEVESPR